MAVKTDRERERESYSYGSGYFRDVILNGLLALAGLPVFPSFDWRFNEFPNSASHALYSTCIELMALPVTGAEVGNALYDIVLKG